MSAEFARELRADRVSHCAVFPEYAEPFTARVIQAVGDIAGPDHQSSPCTWTARIFVTTHGFEQSVDALWKAPWWLKAAVVAARVLGSEPVRPFFRLTRADGRETLEADCAPETIVEALPRRLATRDSAAAV